MVGSETKTLFGTVYHPPLRQRMSECEKVKESVDIEKLNRKKFK